MDLGYKVGCLAAMEKTGAGMLGNIGEVLKDVGSAGANILRSKNPWVRNALVGGGLGAGVNAITAPEGHRTESALKGIVPGAVGGAMWHGAEKGIGKIVGNPSVPMGGSGGLNITPGWGKSLKALSGLDPQLTRGNAVKSLIRRSAPTIGAMAAMPTAYRALGLNPTQQYQEAPPDQGQQYFQQGPFLGR